jgi:iron(II)-dependent oxidoreductase
MPIHRTKPVTPPKSGTRLLLAIALASIAGCSEPEQEAQTGTTSDWATASILIPAGEFLMGDSSEGDHSPVHAVFVDSFYMDKYEVTNAQFYEFCLATDCRLPEFWGMDEFRSGLDYPDHPVVGVSWRDAKAYAEWAGKRLPTEAEWEYAARGGLVEQKYTIGNSLDSTQANFTVDGIATGLKKVGSYPPNGYGLHDMAGNVVEWVADYYDKGFYAQSPTANPTGPQTGKFRVIRGGGWHSGPYCNRVYFRNALPSGWRDFNVGFRCARDVGIE